MNGNIFRLAAAVLVLGGSSLLAQTPPDGALWERARQQLNATRDRVPNEMTLHATFDEKGTDYNTIDSKTVLKGWKNGKPVRKEVFFKETQRDSGLRFLNLDLGLADSHCFWVDAFTLEAQETGTWEGKPCVLFRGKVLAGDPTEVTGTAWVDPDTARLLKMDMVCAVPSNAYVKNVYLSVSYAATEPDLWLPQQWVTRADLTMPFTQLVVTVVQRIDSWTTRP